MTNKMEFVYNSSEIIIVLLSYIFSTVIAQNYNCLKCGVRDFFC